MKKHIQFLSLLAACSIPAAPLLAQTTPDFQARLQNIYDAYKHDSAGSCQRLADALQSAEASTLTSQDAKKAYQFLGNCNYQQKHLDQAIAAYLKTAELDAADPQPLIDAGSVYVEQGLYAQAEEQYKAALQRANGDAAQEKKIRAMIRHIPGKLQKDFTVSTSIGHDSNVNSGPEGTIHLLYGVFNYTLDSNDTARDDFYSYNSASAALSKALNPKTYLLFNANAGHTAYFSEKDFNSSVVSASTGLKKVFNGKSVTFSPFVNHQTLDGESYQFSSGLNITGAASVTKTINIWPHVGGYSQNFYNDDLRDAYGLSVGNSASYAFNPKTSWIGSLFYSYNEADDDRFTYNSVFIGNSINRTLSENLTAGLGYNLQLFDYDAIDPAFGTSREDDGHTVYISFNYALKKFVKNHDAYLNLSSSRNQTNSNQSFYDNRRVFTALKLTCSF